MQRDNPDFWAISSPEWLQNGWDKVRTNQGAHGGDHLTIDQFSSASSSRLLGLSRKLREGNYRPGPLRRVYVPKRNSEELRPLDIPCVGDRVVQAAVAQYLQPALEEEFEDSSFAYRPGRGVHDAVVRIGQYRRQGFTHVVDGDIRKFFENVPHEPLIMQLEELVNDPRLMDLIWTWLEWYAPQGRGLPQGSPLSPALANLYLDSIDEALKTHGVRLVRYADDFIILTRSEGKAEKALERVANLLEGAGLELNLEKTRIVSFDQGFRFLGHVFVRSLMFRDLVVDETPSEDALTLIQNAIQQDHARDAAALSAFDKTPEAAIGGTTDIDYSLSRRWRTLYLLEPGRVLSVSAESFAVYEGDTRIFAIPANRVGRIEVGARCEIKTSSLDLAASYGVPITRLDGYGAPVGHWVPEGQGHAARHMEQFRMAESSAGLEVAREVVMARIFNQFTLLKRLDRKSRDPDIAALSIRFRRLVRRVQFDESIDKMMGREGEAASLFWPAFSKMLPNDWRFPRRARLPASGRGEVALNVVCSLLARDLEVVVRRRGLHPGIGFLHRPRDDGHALVYDLMEEFRSPVVEACVAAAIARGQIEPDMFHRSNKSGWGVKRHGYSALIRAYEATANRTIKDPITCDKTTWRGLYERQAERLALHCEGLSTYQAYRMDY